MLTVASHAVYHGILLPLSVIAVECVETFEHIIKAFYHHDFIVLIFSDFLRLS